MIKEVNDETDLQYVEITVNALQIKIINRIKPYSSNEDA